MKKYIRFAQIVPFGFAQFVQRFAFRFARFAQGFAPFTIIVALFFSACATQDITSNSISSSKGLDAAMREVCWNIESQQQCFEILESGCEVGDYRNCALLGYTYINRLAYPDKNARFSEDKAIELFKKACDGKNGSGCFALQMFDDNPINIIAACEYGDFVACGDIVAKQNAVDSADKIIYAPDVVRWAQERNAKLLQDECEKAELRLKREENKDKIKFREEEVKTYCDFANNAKNP